MLPPVLAAPVARTGAWAWRTTGASQPDAPSAGDSVALLAPERRPWHLGDGEKEDRGRATQRHHADRSLERSEQLFGQFERFRRKLDDAFGVAGLPSSIRSVATGTLPAINVGRTPSSVEVYVFAPGLEASKIDVTLDRDVLRIAGERTSEIPGDNPEVQVYTRERGAGAVSAIVEQIYTVCRASMEEQFSSQS